MNILRNLKQWEETFRWKEILNTRAEDDIYFKMHCLYNAKIEMYDRTLTSIRGECDPTAAFVDCSREVRKASNNYARSLYMWCRENIEYKTRRQFDPVLWRESIKKYYNLSAQGWIDLYEFLVEKEEIEEIEDIQI